MAGREGFDAADHGLINSGDKGGTTSTTADPISLRALDQLRRPESAVSASIPTPIDILLQHWSRVRSVLRVNSTARVVIGSMVVLLSALLAAVVIVRSSARPEARAVPVESTNSFETTTSTTVATIVVAVGGAVRTPGVYRLPIGSRVVDALEAGGGPAADIDLDRINLAALVADGERVWLARTGDIDAPGVGAGPTTGPSAMQGRSGPVDLNSATADELEDLPGIGPATAEAIIDRRREVGRFRSVDDLLSVKGIGTAKLEALRSSVVVR